MDQLNGGGHQPPAEPEISLDDLLDADVRDACDQVEAVELGEYSNKAPKSTFWENFLMGCFFVALSFGIAVWWESEAELGAETLSTPEVNIGVDPNNEKTVADD